MSFKSARQVRTFNCVSYWHHCPTWALASSRLNNHSCLSLAFLLRPFTPLYEVLDVNQTLQPPSHSSWLAKHHQRVRRILQLPCSFADPNIFLEPLHLILYSIYLQIFVTKIFFFRFLYYFPRLKKIIDGFQTKRKNPFKYNYTKDLKGAIHSQLDH